MSTTYKFFVEAFYAGKWYNIDYLTQGTDGCLNHQYLANISRSFLGLLEPLIPSGHCLNFEELAESGGNKRGVRGLCPSWQILRPGRSEDSGDDSEFPLYVRGIRYPQRCSAD